MHSQLLRVLLTEDGVTGSGITLRSLCAQQGRGLELIFVSNRDSPSKMLLHFHPHVSFLHSLCSNPIRISPFRSSTIPFPMSFNPLRPNWIFRIFRRCCFANTWLALLAETV